MLSVAFVLAFALVGVNAQSDDSSLVIFEPGLIANSSDAAAEGTLAPGCIAAMEQKISCNPYLRSMVVADEFGALPSSIREAVCSVNCSESLEKYHSSVQSACAGSPQPWDGTPAVFYGDQIWAQYNISCFKDSNGNYCPGEPIDQRRLHLG